jgi:hypothetical protein
MLAWGDLAVRYKQTVIGLAWAASYRDRLHGDLRPDREFPLDGSAH